MILAHKIALDPNEEQAIYFARSCGVSRFAWNWALAHWQQEYALWREYRCGPKPSEASLRRELNALKAEAFPWMTEVTKNAPQQAIKNLGAAFKNFFAGRAKYPRFKKKGVSHDSFRADSGTDKQHPNAVEVDGKRVKLPIIGWVKMREAVRFIGQIKSAIVSRVADRWFVSLTVEVDHTPPVRETQAAGGVFRVDGTKPQGVFCGHDIEFSEPEVRKTGSQAQDCQPCDAERKATCKMAVRVRVRRNDNGVCIRSESGDDHALRVHESCARTSNDRKQGCQEILPTGWATPGIQHLEGHDPTLHKSQEPKLSPLRRKGDRGMSSMEGQLRPVLSGCGSDPSWSGNRPDQQRRGIRAGECPGDDAQHQHGQRASSVGTPEQGRERQVPIRFGGVDLGVKALATLSDGSTIEGPKALRRNLKALRRCSRALSRKVKGSANRRKSAARLARLHARIANVRQDALHKATTEIVRKFTVIGIEDLNVRGIMANHCLALAIADIGAFEFRRQLEYKAPMNSARVAVANRWFPSSRLCSACGHLHAGLTLSDREWTCDGCGAVHDRDHNASVNLANMAASSAATACGAGSSGLDLAIKTKLPAVKQEPTHGTFVHV